jgi:hypothetical protein
MKKPLFKKGQRVGGSGGPGKIVQIESKVSHAYLIERKDGSRHWEGEQWLRKPAPKKKSKF